MPSASSLLPFSLPSPSLFKYQVDWSLSQYKQTHRLPGPADKSLEFHYTSHLHLTALPRESHTSPQSTVRYACWISPFHLVRFLPTHTLTALLNATAPLISPFTSQSKFIIGDKGLPLPFPRKKKNLYRSKIRQSPAVMRVTPEGFELLCGGRG